MIRHDCPQNRCQIIVLPSRKRNLLCPVRAQRHELQNLCSLQDAKRSAATFHELDALLGMIIALREAMLALQAFRDLRAQSACAAQANGGTGPDERETNLKLVYEQARVDLVVE